MGTRFLEGLQKDGKVFLFFCILLSILRAAFIWIYKDQLTADMASLIGESLWLGFRLSLKTSGAIVVVTFLLATIVHALWEKWPGDRIRNWWGMSIAFFLAFLFCVRIPYYKIFNSAFNIMLINGLYDDKNAILDTGINEYGLLWRLPLAIFFSIVVAYGYKKWMKTPIYSCANLKKRKLVVVVCVLLLPVLAIGIRYGGAFSYARSVTWENAQRLPSTLLNEAILDDAQALYRVRTAYKRLKSREQIKVSEADLKKAVGILGGNGTAHSIDEAFQKKVTIPKLGRKPSKVVFILGESYGLWPFLPEFAPMNLVPEATRLMQSGKAMYTDTLLSHAVGTMSSFNGLVTGLPFVDLYENYRPNSFVAPYKTGIGSMMKEIGYRTVLWYGGFESWQNIKAFSLAQGFDEFRSANDFSYEGGNSWGAPDGELFKEIERYMASESSDTPVFHFILTSTNHPPYSHPVDAEGFPRSEVEAHRPDSVPSGDKTLTELGHFWYADKVMGEFIRHTEKSYPDALFVITADHSERFVYTKEMDLKTFSAVPAIIYGEGVDPNWLPKGAVGAHTQLTATLAELIAPAGATYHSIVPSLFNNGGMGYNFRLWVDREGIKRLSDKNTPKALLEQVEAGEMIATWRVIKGNRWSE